MAQIAVRSALGGGWGEPGGRVGVEITVSWPMTRDSREKKSVMLSTCSAHTVGWVRVHRKQGLLDMPSGVHSDVSPLLAAKFGAEMEQGHVLQLFTSERVPIMNNMTVSEGEERSFTFEFTLPPVIPPSFSGKAFSVAYAVVVEAQLQGVGNIIPPLRMCHVPVRLRSKRPPEHLHRLHTYGGTGGIPHDFRATSNSIDGGERSVCAEPRGLPGAHVGAERGGAQRFMIKMGEEHVMCLLLSQKVYTCGECVVACIDFAGAARLCTKVVLSLESHETLLMQRADQSYVEGKGDGQPPTQSTVHATATELTAYSKNLQVLLPVPLNAPATLCSTIGSVSWTLRLQITTVAHKDQGSDQGAQHTVTWSAPLVIAPLIDLSRVYSQSSAPLS